MCVCVIVCVQGIVFLASPWTVFFFGMRMFVTHGASCVHIDPLLEVIVTSASPDTDLPKQCFKPKTQDLKQYGLNGSLGLTVWRCTSSHHRLFNFYLISQKICYCYSFRSSLFETEFLWFVWCLKIRKGFTFVNFMEIATLVVLSCQTGLRWPKASVTHYILTAT